MKYFPLFLDLNNKPVFVVGGGEVATRKVEALLKAGAKITLVSPDITSFLQNLVKESQIKWLEQSYQRCLLNRDYVQVWATTDHSELNHQIHADARMLGILVNVVDDQPYCDFITPSMITRGKIQIAISSGGASPVLIRNLRESVEAVLPQNLSLLAEFGGQKREQIKADLPDINLRRAFWENFFADRAVKDATTTDQLESRYQALFTHSAPATREVVWVSYNDDIELLPLKALRYMQKADLVFHHSGMTPDVLELCRRDASRVVYEHPHDLRRQVSRERGQHQCLCILVKEKNGDVSELFEAGDRRFGAGTAETD